VNLHRLEALLERIILNVESGARDGTLRLVEGVSRDMVLSRWGFRVFEPLSEG
jgi:hypothetical protein